MVPVRGLMVLDFVSERHSGLNAIAERQRMAVARRIN